MPTLAPRESPVGAMKMDGGVGAVTLACVVEKTEPEMVSVPLRWGGWFVHAPERMERTVCVVVVRRWKFAFG